MIKDTKRLQISPFFSSVFGSLHESGLRRSFMTLLFLCKLNNKSRCVFVCVAYVAVCSCAVGVHSHVALAPIKPRNAAPHGPTVSPHSMKVHMENPWLVSIRHWKRVLSNLTLLLSSHGYLLVMLSFLHVACQSYNRTFKNSVRCECASDSQSTCRDDQRICGLTCHQTNRSFLLL